MAKKGEMMVTSIFSFAHYVFYQSKKEFLSSKFHLFYRLQMLCLDQSNKLSLVRS